MAGRRVMTTVAAEEVTVGFSGYVRPGDVILVFNGAAIDFRSSGASSGRKAAAPLRASTAAPVWATPQRGRKNGALQAAVLEEFARAKEPMSTADLLLALGVPVKHERRTAVGQVVWRMARDELLSATKDDEGKLRPRYVLTAAGRAKLKAAGGS